MVKLKRIREFGSPRSMRTFSDRSGSHLIGWTKEYANSRIVYLRCGDDPVAYASSYYRQLVRNAIEWVSADRAG